jgi:hypothetical protein
MQIDTTTGMPPMIGRKLTIAEWLDYVQHYDFGSIPPSRVVLHHTYKPDEADWRGLTSMRGMQTFYRGKGWSAAPHIYVAPDGIWLFTPMADVGIHAGTGNSGTWNGKWGYSIGLEMVGFFDTKLPSGIVWSEAKAVMGALSRRLNIPPRQLISFHRDYTNEKSCPGWKVTKDWVWKEVENWLANKAPIMPMPSITVNSTLIASPRATAQQAINYIFNRGQGYYQPVSIREIVSHYWRIAPSVGIDPLLLIAQAIHETSERYPTRNDSYKPMCSWWSERPRRNGSGYGVTGAGSVAKPRFTSVTVDGVVYATWAQKGTKWLEGISFPTWEHHVRAQTGRWLAYALQPHETTPEQQVLIDYALALRPLHPLARGTALTLKPLGAIHNPTNAGKPREQWIAGWAWPGDKYGESLATIANAIQQAQP